MGERTSQVQLGKGLEELKLGKYYTYKSIRELDKAIRNSNKLVEK